MKYSCGFADDGIGHNCCKIVDEVKKRIEETDSNIKYFEGLSHYSGMDAHARACANMNAEKRFCEIKLQSELQKIMDDKDDR